MKQGVSLLAFGLVAVLAACGGGGGSSGPVPVPIATIAPTQYASRLVFVGTLAGVQTSLRRAEMAAPMSASATPIPIMVVSEPEAGVNTGFYGGQIEAEVSPLPSSSPSVSFSQTNPDAVLSTPAPTSSPQPLPSGVIAEASIGGTSAVQSQASGTASADIGNPVNQAPTAPVYSYMSIALDCSPANGGVLGSGYSEHFGWKWTGTAWTPDDNVADADIYIDGPGCTAPNPSESQATIHIPAGDIRMSTDTPFSSVAASQWQNTETSFTIQQAITKNPDGSDNGLVIGKTIGGATFKLFPNGLNLNVGYFGAIEVSGSAVDGF